MRAEWTLLVGLALGAGGALAAVATGRTQPVPPVSDAEVLGPARAAPGEVVATLVPAPAPAEPAPPARGSPAGAAVVEVDLGDLLELAKTPPGKNATWSVHATIADLYAHAGRDGALRRVLDAALAAGESPTNLIGYLALLPPERRARALSSFLADHPDPKPAPATLAWVWLACGDPTRALAAASEHLAALKGNDQPLLASLYAADADKADFLAWRLATEGDWPAASLSSAIAAACAASRLDLVPRWQQRLQLLQGPVPVVKDPTEDDRQQAVALAEQQMREEPEDADRWVEVARTRAEAGDRRGALAAWRTAIEKAGPDSDLLTQFAAFDAAAAFPTIEAAARETQEDDVLLAYVDACLRVGKPDEAGAAFFRMHTLEADEWLHAGIASLAPWPALARMERLLSHRAYREKAVFHLARADALLALGRGAAAYDAYLKFEDGGGDKDRAWDGLLRADPVRAAARFGEMRTGPDSEVSERLESVHALALLRSGRAEAAKALAEPLLARWEAGSDAGETPLPLIAPIFPERVLALVERLAEYDYDRDVVAETLAALGRTAAARAAYDASLQEGSDDARTLIGRGRCR
jgi:tetratricopeptide (TPR) repeat protein